MVIKIEIKTMKHIQLCFNFSFYTFFVSHFYLHIISLLIEAIISVFISFSTNHIYFIDHI